MKKIALVVLVLCFALWWFKDPTISVPTNDIRFGYLVKYSTDGSRNDHLPMLVALHGNGDTAKHFYNTALDELHTRARIVLLKGPLRQGLGRAWPGSPAGVEHYGKAVHEAIDLLAYKYPTVGKPILLGFSGGGMMAYYQAVKYGNSYSSIFPVSGRLSKEFLGDQSGRRGARVFAFHGKNDSVISISGGKNAAKLLRRNGVNVKFAEFDGGHQGIFSNMKSRITQVIEQELERLK